MQCGICGTEVKDLKICVCVITDREIQQLGSGVSAVASGASSGLGGGRVQEQLIVLKCVDQTGNVANKRLSLFGRHSFGESATLQGKRNSNSQRVVI